MSYAPGAPPKAMSAAVHKKWISHEEEEEPVAQNIMFNRRVCRGSTYARRVVNQSTPLPSSKRNLSRRRPQQQQRSEGRGVVESGEHTAFERPRTPAAVAGRQHLQVQTESYLEVLTDKPEEVDMSMQTDPYLDRPVSPLFMPMPSGESKATQIEEGDLFDFDLEVIPIVEVLVGKTLEQAIMQVLEEKELSELRKHQEQFEQLRNVELAETQRLEARETRLFEEKQRRKRQEQERVEKEEELARKIASRTVSKQYLSGLQSSVFQHLSRVGHFSDPLIQQVEKEFMPWLAEKVATRVQEHRAVRLVTECICDDAIIAGKESSQSALNETQETLRQLEDERKLKEQQKQQAEEAERLRQLEAEATTASGDTDAQDQDADE